MQEKTASRKRKLLSEVPMKSKAKLKNPLRDLTRAEWAIWLISIAMVLVSELILGGGSLLSTVASILGVTALIFVAKGYVLGQVLSLFFGLFYAAVSFLVRYYGEMLICLLLTAPMAVFSVVSWLRHPYRDSKEVEVSRPGRKQVLVLLALAAVVTAAFYFILRALGTASLTVSTISIFTSFLATGLSFLRSPFYALAYAANDLVLITLWLLAIPTDSAALSMVICFAAFLLNDLYGFINWRRMQKRQAEGC